MPAMLWRVLFAVVCVVIVYALIPPLSHILGFALTADVMAVVKICVAAIAVIYIIWGPNTPPWRQA